MRFIFGDGYDARARRAGRGPDGGRPRPGHRLRQSRGRTGALRRAGGRRRGRRAPACARRIGDQASNDVAGWRSRYRLRETDSVSALAFTIVALVLIGPVPAMLARASWPLRAPRAAFVLWQSIALAAVLSAFSAGIAIASRLFVPGPDGRPTATITSEIEVLGWPLWIVYVAVFALTLVIGARLAVAVVQVAI